jgi:hypothetical protein
LEADDLDDAREKPAAVAPPGIRARQALGLWQFAA